MLLRKLDDHENFHENLKKMKKENLKNGRDF